MPATAGTYRVPAVSEQWLHAGGDQPGRHRRSVAESAACGHLVVAGARPRRHRGTGVGCQRRWIRGLIRSPMERRTASNHVCEQRQAASHDWRQAISPMSGPRRFQWSIPLRVAAHRRRRRSPLLRLPRSRSARVMLMAAPLETVTLTGGLGGATDWLALASTASPNTTYLQVDLRWGRCDYADVDGHDANGARHLRVPPLPE